MLHIEEYILKISIITPTYNRAAELRRLYKSIKDQNYDMLEWIIVNDGSTDDTDIVVTEFINEDELEIVYLKQFNQGKHSALNKAIKIASGEVCFFVDSDDYLTVNSLSIIKNQWINVRHDKSFAGISGSCLFNNGDSIGDFALTKEMDYVDATTFEYRYKYKVKGDRAEVFRTEVIKNYKFPIFAGEKFLPEAVIYNRIGNDQYKLRWFNEPLYICEYREDGLTAQGNKLFLESWTGYSLYVREMLKYKDVPSVFKAKLIFNYLKIVISYKKEFLLFRKTEE